MSNKIIIAKDGFNAKTETKSDNLRFSSDYNTLKYYKSGNVTVSVTLNDNNQHSDVETVAIDLDYSPAFIAYVQDVNWNFCPFLKSGVWGFNHVNAYYDPTNKFFCVVLMAKDTVTAKPVTYTYNVYYKIFKNDTGFVTW
jgi:hypothetical protein